MMSDGPFAEEFRHLVETMPSSASAATQIEHGHKMLDVLVRAYDADPRPGRAGLIAVTEVMEPANPGALRAVILAAVQRIGPPE